MWRLCPRLRLNAVWGPRAPILREAIQAFCVIRSVNYFTAGDDDSLIIKSPLREADT
jgi:hypothetical protein